MTKYPVFIVKGDAPLYGESWTDDYHVISKDKYVLGQTVITCDNNVTNAQAMFALCRNLTSIDLSGFDTSKIFNMSCMFMECNSLTDMKSCTRYYLMFKDCFNLRDVKIKNPPADFRGGGLRPSQYTIVS